MTLLGDGRGGFAPETFGKRCPDAFRAKSVACADFDGDGWVDMFVGMADPDQSRLYLNDRRGMFVDATFTHLPFALNGCVQRIVTVDIDSDGDLDLALAMGGYCGPKHHNVVLLNDGLGHFLPSWLFGRVHWSIDVGVGDVDGDGRPDLVFANGNDPAELWLNSGQGQFVDASNRLPTVAAFTHMSVVVQDVDGDARNDIVLGAIAPTGYSVTLWRNLGPQGFGVRDDLVAQPRELQAYWLASADMDRDGDLDVVMGGHQLPLSNPLRGLKVFVNTKRHLLPNGAPAIGRTWQIALHAKPNQFVVAALAGASQQTDLGPLGVFGLHPSSLAWLPMVDMRQSCVQTLAIPVPNVPPLRGRSIFAQACVVDVFDPTQTRLTNWTSDVVQ